MDLVQISVKKISQNQSQNGAFVLIMQDLESDFKLPIVIGAFEAQAIVLELEPNIARPRPLTHDLFKTFAKSFGISILEVIIYKIEDGIFYSKMLCEKDSQQHFIEARTSDAIALALRFNAPIYTHKDILLNVGINMPDPNDTLHSMMGSVEEIDQQENGKGTSKFSRYSTNELRKMLEECLENEDYELATEIRDELLKREI